jgi:hypothetical protein
VQDAHDLPEDDRPTVVVHPDFVQLVVVRRFVESRQETARTILDASHASRHRGSVDVHVEGRKKNRDLQPVSGRRPAAVARAGDHHASISRRHHEIRTLWNLSIGIPEEVREKGTERRKAGAPAIATCGSESRRGNERSCDERIAGAIDSHEEGVGTRRASTGGAGGWP